MKQTYFLGANTRDGFSSLYAFFPGSKDSFLHIIKGGPGTGKSSFMRRIGEAAEARGMDVHYVLCSGDPKSLDGVWIPALRQAWVDGTAPHVCEPRFFGVDADYVNLGRFCRTPLTPSDSREIQALTRDYRAAYAEAYRCLAAAELRETPSDRPSEAMELFGCIEAADALPCPPERRFLSAVTREGVIRLSEEIEKLCPHVRQVSPASLASLSGELDRLRLPAVRCPLAIDCSLPEAILLPWAGCAFVCAREFRGLEKAVDALRRAGERHDRLEQIYGGYMDFPALSDFTERAIHQLFAG